MPIEGPLKELDIHDVFQLLDLGRKTGVVRVTSELRQNGGSVYFEGGAVVAAVIQSNPHPLGGLLLKSGKILEQDLARARAVQAAGDPRRLGDILVELGAVSRRELDRHVRAQVEEVIFELMSWSEGYFSFADGPFDRSGIEAAVRIPTEALLMEAARRIDEWSRIESRVPHLGVIPRLPEASADGGLLDLVPFEWEVLAASDGMRDLRAMAAALGRSEFDVARTVFGLASAGLLVLDDPLAGPAPAARPRDLAGLVALADDHLAVGDAESARLTAAELLERFPGQAPGYLVLGRALLAGGQHEEAAGALQQALGIDPLLAPAQRLLGLARVAAGRFDEAIECWDRWAALATRPAEEAALGPALERLRDAAQTLADALRSRHD
ncbi:MAG TPA: DUF4388 domain-containing protein [Gemmatimonadales bacterium]|nr:DUF4388 domain-containing protein [Gemmatimonadales bacterium]